MNIHSSHAFHPTFSVSIIIYALESLATLNNRKNLSPEWTPFKVLDLYNARSQCVHY